MADRTFPDRPSISPNAFVLYENGVATDERLNLERKPTRAGEHLVFSIDLDEINGEFVLFLFQDEQHYRSFFQDILVRVMVNRIVNARVYWVGFREPTDWSQFQAPIQVHVGLADTSEIYNYGGQQAPHA